MSFAPTRKMIFDGKRLAREKEKKLQKKVDSLKKRGIVPKLVAIQVGENKASEIYLRVKKRVAEKVGVDFKLVRLKNSLSMNRFIDTIEKLNKDKSVHGVMIQLPLPEKLKPKTKDLIEKIALEKDVDGLREDSKFVHSTVKAILCAIEEAGVGTESGKNIVRLPLKEAPCKVVVVGSRGMVGKPLIRQLKKAGYEVIGCHSQTKNIKAIISKADILISSTGVPNLIRKDMVKKRAVVIDVGSPKGDVARDACKRASFISPVPGGIGPLTVYFLMENLVRACE